MVFAEKKAWQNRPSGFHRRFWRSMDFTNKPRRGKKVVRRAFELGINYFDTAKLYGDSEEKIGTALKDARKDCILATKTGSRKKNHWQTSRLLFSYPKTHFRLAGMLVYGKNRVKHPCSFKVIVYSCEKIKILLLKYLFYFLMV